MTLELSNAVPFAPFFLFIGLTRIDLPFKGGVMVPSPDFIVDVFSTGGSGGFTMPLTWNAGAPGGFSFWTQAWVVDGTAPAGAAGTNGLRADVQ